MNEAKYEILIPQGGIAPHALQHLISQIQTTAAHIEQRNVFQHGVMTPYDVLVFQAMDEPHTDSQAKQTAVYAGEVANVQEVIVSKTGKSGIQTWPIRNPQFQQQAIQPI